MFPFNFDDNEISESNFNHQNDYVDNSNEYAFNNPMTGFPNDKGYKHGGRNNVYDKDKDFDRRDFNRRDFDKRDFDRRDFDKRDFDRHDFDRHKGSDDWHGNDMPKSAPPRIIPEKNQGPALRAVDPMAIRGCLYKYTYIWLANRQQFWMYPTYIGRTSVAGYRWNGYRWTYTGFDLKLVESFSCVG